MYIAMIEQSGWTQSDNVSAAFSLARQAFQGFAELVELNQQTAKAALADSEQTVQMALSGKTPVELWVHHANAVRPAAEKALSYNRQVLEIAAHTQAELLKIADARLEQHNLKLQALVDGFARNAPAGSEAAVTVLKSTISNASVAYETVRKATAQAIAMAQRTQPATPSPA